MKTTQEERDEIKRLALENPRRSIYPVIPAFMADDVDALLAEWETLKALLRECLEWEGTYLDDHESEQTMRIDDGDLRARIEAALKGEER